MKMMVFRLGGNRFCLPTLHVQEVAPMATLLRPPGLPSVLEGFLNLGGVGVPVLRLARLFGLAEGEPDYGTALVILRCEPSLALLVDEVENVVEMAAEARVSLDPGNTFNDGTSGSWDDGRGPIHVLAVERILLEEERLRLTELQAQMQTRLQMLDELVPS
jgi:purine-binding chemotaxis protein CheW